MNVLIKNLLFSFAFSIFLIVISLFGTSTAYAKAVSADKDLQNGYPLWYEDDKGVRVAPCLDGVDPKCVLPEAGEESNFDPIKPSVLGTNFPSEFFYWIAESNLLRTPSGGKVLYRAAVEGAFVNEDPIDDDQMVFGRIRVTGTGLTPNSTYKVTHPYGVDFYQTNSVGVMARRTSTQDIGCAGVPCDFSQALSSRVFGGFLKWDSGAPEGYIGDATTPHTVTGSPIGNNFFKIEGSGLPIGGLQTALFTISGKLASIVAPPPPPGCSNTAPGQATLSSPINGATNIVLSPTVSWNAISDFGINCAGNNNQYEVFLAEGTSSLTTQGMLPATQSSLALANLKPNTTYSWKVRVHNGALSTDSTLQTFTTVNVIVTKPTAPRFLTISNQAGGILLKWTDSSSNETEFRIERKVGISGVFGQIASVGANITSYTDTTAPTGWLFYRVRACNLAGCSLYTNTIGTVKR